MTQKNCTANKEVTMQLLLSLPHPRITFQHFVIIYYILEHIIYTHNSSFRKFSFRMANISEL